jgi:MFS family permease
MNSVIRTQKSQAAASPNVRLLIAVFLVVTGTSVVAPLLSRDAQALGSGPLGIAVLYSGFYLVRLICGPVISRWAMSVGTKRVLSMGTMLYPILGIGYWMAHTVLVLLLVRLVHGLASAIMLPMASAYLSQRQGGADEHGRWMAWYQFSIFSASACGPVFGGYLAHVFTIRQAFLALVLLGLVATTIVRTLPKVFDHPNFAHSAEAKSPIGRLARCDSRLWPLLSLNFGLAMIDIYWVSFFPLRAAQFRLTIEEIGLLIGVINAIGALVQMPLTKYANRFVRVPWILPVLIALAVVFNLGMAIPARAGWLVAVLAVAIVSSILPTLTYTLASQLGRTLGASSTVMVRLGMATSAGMIVGPLLSGFSSIFSHSRGMIALLMAAIWLAVLVMNLIFPTTIT